jgi:hypothetical protein
MSRAKAVNVGAAAAEVDAVAAAVAVVATRGVVKPAVLSTTTTVEALPPALPMISIRSVQPQVNPLAQRSAPVLGAVTSPAT